MERGKFIVLEGVNSCGKTVHQNLLIARCMKEFPDKKFISTAEPTYDLPIGKALREIYLSGKRKSDSVLMANLFATDRYDHFSNPDNGLLVKLNNGCNVIQSRNYLSSLAICTSDDDKYGIDYVYQLNKSSIDLLSPDIIIVIERDIESILKYHSEKEEIDVNETRDKLVKNFEGYQKAIAYLMKNTNENIVRINGCGSVEETNEMIWKVIKDLF